VTALLACVLAQQIGGAIVADAFGDQL